MNWREREREKSRKTKKNCNKREERTKIEDLFQQQKYFSQKIDGQSYLMTGSSDDGREHSPGGIVPSESGFAHAGAIVHD